mgnify:CR=1 FL=1
MAPPCIYFTLSKMYICRSMVVFASYHQSFSESISSVKEIWAKYMYLKSNKAMLLIVCLFARLGLFFWVGAIICFLLGGGGGGSFGGGGYLVRFFFNKNKIQGSYIGKL